MTLCTGRRVDANYELYPEPLYLKKPPTPTPRHALRVARVLII